MIIGLIIIGLIIIGFTAIMGSIVDKSQKNKSIESELLEKVKSKIKWETKSEYDYKSINIEFTTIEREENILKLYGIVELTNYYNEKYTAKYNGVFGNLQSNNVEKVTVIEENITTPTKSK